MIASFTLTPPERVAVLMDEWGRLEFSAKQQLAYEAILWQLGKPKFKTTPGTIGSGVVRLRLPSVSCTTINTLLRRLGFLYYRSGELVIEKDQYPQGAWSCSGQMVVQYGGTSFHRVWRQNDSTAEGLIMSWLMRSDLVDEEANGITVTKCLVCETGITQTPRGRKRTYCSGPCRQKAYRQR